MRLPKENLYTTRCPQCGCLVLLSGDELRQRYEAVPLKNHGYTYKCPGCEGKISYTTTELLMTTSPKTYLIDIDDYFYAKDRVLGHGIILEEGEPHL